MESYGQLSTLFYDWDKPDAPEIALAWYLAGLPRPAPTSRILEPMCGSGRFLVPLLKAGFRVDGVDLSREMLDACRLRIAGHEESCELFEQSLTELDLPFKQYSAAFIPASSFCLIADRGQALQALTRTYQHLEPDAKLLLEFEPPVDFDPEHVESTKVLTKGGQQIRLHSKREYDSAEQLEIHQNQYELKKSGKVVAEEFEELRLRCYSDEQMKSLLCDAGFVNVAVEKPSFGRVAVAMKPAK